MATFPVFGNLPVEAVLENVSYATKCTAILTDRGECDYNQDGCGHGQGEGEGFGGGAAGRKGDDSAGAGFVPGESDKGGKDAGH